MSMLLTLLSPLIRSIPSVASPTRHITYSEKTYWTLLVLLLYLVLSQLPLYGIEGASSDPLHTIRVIMASNRGTLMEQGLSPSMTAGFVMQLLSSLGLTSPAHELHEPLQNLVTLVITLCQALYAIYSGRYGPSLPLATKAAIVLQLFAAGFVLQLMDALLSNGWGLGSGSSLFIACNYCETVVWRALSVVTFSKGRFKVFEGSLLSLFHLLAVRRSKLRALKEALFRAGAPNLSQLAATFAVFCLVVYLQGFRVNLPLQHNKVRNGRTSYPIKLFYTSTMPVIIQSQVTLNVLFLAQLLLRRFTGTQPAGNYFKPAGNYFRGALRAVCWVLEGPEDPAGEKARFLAHALWVLGSCGLFSRAWIEMSGAAPKDVARKLKEKDMSIMGYRQESSVRVLYKYIPIAAWSGGVAIGMITVVSELLGAVGSGTGILLAVGTIFGYYESWVKDGIGENVNFLGM